MSKIIKILVFLGVFYLIWGDGRAEKDEIFQYARPLSDVSPTGFDRQDCVFANRMFRTMVNRFRAISYQVERRCLTKKGGSRCKKYTSKFDHVLKKMRKQALVIKKKCLLE
jgi:hypothetical protein